MTTKSEATSRVGGPGLSPNECPRCTSGVHCPRHGDFGAAVVRLARKDAGILPQVIWTGADNSLRIVEAFPGAAFLLVEECGGCDAMGSPRWLAATAERRAEAFEAYARELRQRLASWPAPVVTTAPRPTSEDAA